MRGLPNRGIVHAQVAADRADDDFSRVEADPDLHPKAPREEHLVGVRFDGLLHPQGCVTGPDGMILVRQRRTEQRHDPVAQHLVDRAFVPVHGLHHPFEHRVEDRSCFLRIPVGEQLHRAFEVGEENGHLLALAFEGGP
jgi:hypothetical protein